MGGAKSSETTFIDKLLEPQPSVPALEPAAQEPHPFL